MSKGSAFAAKKFVFHSPFEESTPTEETWTFLRTSYETQTNRLWRSAEDREPPVFIDVPPLNAGEEARLNSCVVNCVEFVDKAMGNSKKMEIRFGLKVFMVQSFGGVYVATRTSTDFFEELFDSPPPFDIIGVKAVVHTVVYDHEKKRYVDPSPEVGESRILFIHIPHMFSEEQTRIILSNPKSVRMGTVGIGVGHPPIYEQIERLDVWDNYMERLSVSDLDLFIVNGPYARLHRVEEDGSLTERGAQLTLRKGKR